LKTREQITAVVKAVAPKPVNVLIGTADSFALSELAEMGVRRISVGGALARTAWTGFIRAAGPLLEGRFDGFADLISHSELNQLFGSRPS
jgi:2-methylisocitrate lyase-like PEP mutase family enzyme